MQTNLTLCILVNVLQSKLFIFIHEILDVFFAFQLCSYAKDWATKLAKADSFEHRQNQDFGENLFCCWSSDPKAKCPGKKPVDSWYSEIKKYNFGSEPTSTASGE